MAFAKPTTDVTEFKIGDENERISQTKRNEPGSIPSSFANDLIFNFYLSF